MSYPSFSRCRPRIKINPDKKPKNFKVREIKQSLIIKIQSYAQQDFQITRERVDKENYLNEDTLQQGDGSFYDYCAEIDDEERKQYIANLVKYALPKGMFELTSDDTIRYNGGMEQWKEGVVADIRKKAEAITTENILEWGPVYYLKEALKNPLNTDYHFYLDGEGWQSYAEQSFAFMDFVNNLEVGTTLYIGGVIDYHF